jgi:hypothetical protein
MTAGKPLHRSWRTKEQRINAWFLDRPSWILPGCLNCRSTSYNPVTPIHLNFWKESQPRIRSPLRTGKWVALSVGIGRLDIYQHFLRSKSNVIRTCGVESLHHLVLMLNRSHILSVLILFLVSTVDGQNSQNPHKWDRRTRSLSGRTRAEIWDTALGNSGLKDGNETRSVRSWQSPSIHRGLLWHKFGCSVIRLWKKHMITWGFMIHGWATVF